MTITYVPSSYHAQPGERIYLGRCHATIRGYRCDHFYRIARSADDGNDPRRLRCACCVERADQLRLALEEAP